MKARCLHARRRKVHERDPYGDWTEIYCRDCKAEVIEHNGVWVLRAVPDYADLVREYRDGLAAEVTT